MVLNEERQALHSWEQLPLHWAHGLFFASRMTNISWPLSSGKLVGSVLTGRVLSGPRQTYSSGVSLGDQDISILWDSGNSLRGGSHL